MSGWVAGAVVVAGVAGAVASDQASKRASHDAKLAAGQANKLAGDQYSQTREDMAPWRNAGGSAIGQLSYLLGLPGYDPKDPNAAEGTTYNTQLGSFGSLNRDFSAADFQADPGYEFRMSQGQKALERSAAAGGRYLGGGTLKALTRYGQDMGSQEYGNAFNRFQTNRNTRFNQLAAVAGIGQTSTGQLAQLGAQNATNQGNNLMGAATVSGNAAMAGAAGWTGALNNGVNNWLTYKYGK